jgi:hypothetical protein
MLCVSVCVVHMWVVYVCMVCVRSVYVCRVGIVWGALSVCGVCICSAVWYMCVGVCLWGVYICVGVYEHVHFQQNAVGSGNTGLEAQSKSLF